MGRPQRAFNAQVLQLDSLAQKLAIFSKAVISSEDMA
jgi:hypothetical protein